MHLQALATTVPAANYTQAQCWDIVQRSTARSRLSRRSSLILRAILRGDSGIEVRHFAMPEIERVFDLDADALNAAFRREAPKLAGDALVSALGAADVEVGELDALFVCTCTGYLCPGVSSYVSEQRGLRPGAFLQDLVGLGCGAAIPTLRAASCFLAAHPRAVVACVAVEVCSAAFYLDDDPGVLISACLFSDGAAATVWRGVDSAGSGLRVRGFDTLHRPADRDRLRFEQRGGKLRNLLDASVPQVAADAVHRLFHDEQLRCPERPIERIIAHPGGRDVLDAVETALPGHRLDASRKILARNGNMSSPSVLFALEEALKDGRPKENADWWLVSFGAGFSAHGCRIGLA